MSRNPSPATAAPPWHLDAAVRSVRIDAQGVAHAWPYIDTGGDGPALVMLPGELIPSGKR